MTRPFRHGDEPCPAGILAIAINRELTHVGFFYTREGEVRLCDFQNEKFLAERDADPRYYWVPIDLDEEEAYLITASLRQVYRDHPHDLPYSLRYTANAFDRNGNVVHDAGFTCSTFIVAVLEMNEFLLVDLKSWPSRPDIEEQLRKIILNQPLPADVETRLKNEEIEFRLLPVELCGAACSRPYPTAFADAASKANLVREAIAECEDARRNQP